MLRLGTISKDMHVAKTHPLVDDTFFSLHMHRLVCTFTLQIMLARRSQAEGITHLCNANTPLVCHAFSLYVYADTHILMHKYIISTCTLIVSSRVVYTAEKNKTHSLRILRTMRDMYQDNREGVSQQHHPAHPRSRKCKTNLSSV